MGFDFLSSTFNYVNNHKLPIIPLHPGTNTPACEWLERKTTTAIELITCRKQYRRHNVGLILGETEHHNLLCIEIDGLKGFRMWCELQKVYGDAQDTWTIVNPSGNLRLLYSLPMGVKTKKSKDAVPLDGQHQEVAFICQGQQTVLPPSTINKLEYEWYPFTEPGEIDIAPAPEWIVARVTENCKEDLK